VSRNLNPNAAGLIVALSVWGSFSLGVSAGVTAGLPPLAPYDETAAGYARTESRDRIARLAARMEGGEIELRSETTFGYLPALLKELQISPASQLLVFSKTSSQRQQITPRTPRALYFNDEAFIAWLPNSGRIELAGMDPKLGAVFYSLDAKASKARLVRDNRCLECHATSKSLGVPGLLVRSFRASADGEIDIIAGRSMVTHATPFAERWGGWYVTGTHGHLIHLGNLFGDDAWGKHEKDPQCCGNLTDLGHFLDASAYPASGSDIIALMVLEHEAHMLNLLARLRFESDLVLGRQGGIRDVQPLAEATLRYLLFVDEAPLTDPVRGNSGFTAWFEGQGPMDLKGRSLRQFDLQTRLFRHRCSPLIYSRAFDELPSEMKKHLYHRLWQILSGEDKSPEFAGLPAAERQAILGILRDTKTDVPVYWKL
jgi:hypothetical protein